MFNFGYIEGYVTMIEFTIYEFFEKWRGHSFLLGATYGAKTSDFHVLNRGQLVSNFTVALIKHLACNRSQDCVTVRVRAIKFDDNDEK